MKSAQIPWPEKLHGVQRRYVAEELVRLRRSDEPRRSAAPHRAAKIDPNPHQIEAVIFALARLREGGCILADEVGLGKTIEAGLVMAQLLAEGAQRILLIAPKSLVGQWKQELFQLFDLPAKEASPKIGSFDGPGIFVINREGAGSVKGHEALMSAAPFDLCVIDEAHEMFASVYKRFGRDGVYNPEAEEAQTAGRVREVLQAGQTPVLLLTATPIQNNLVELWGLVQYVDPLGTLLGDLPTFREIFCGADDRQLAPGQEDELRARLKQVLQRTLRRQAQTFLERPFVHRQARLFEYPMSPAERSLYDDVTQYLLEPGILAFQGNYRQLLLLGFHRRMASSTRALAASLERVAARLRRMLQGDVAALEAADLDALVGDLDDGVLEETEGAASLPLHATKEALQHELRRVEGYVARATAVADDDGKFKALLGALRFVQKAAAAGQGAEKLVIFTESLVTQEHLREQLIASGQLADADLTLFRGLNDSPRAKQALARWQAEVPHDETTVPSADIATRLALVHEFKTRSRVLISTEAGAKGLNLQFCNTVVNYDLPWNPQRIEQRIGRCHRYGQQHDVTVINFLAKDNEAQALTFDILSQKLELFGTVLSASDEVLHRPKGPGGEVLASALGAEFEGELRRIYERARTIDEVTAELRALRDKVAEERKRFEEAHVRTASVIEEQLDDTLQSLFRQRKAALPEALAELDADLELLVLADLNAREVPFTKKQTPGGLLLRVEGPNPLTVALGAAPEHVSLHVGHPLVVAAVAHARSEGPFSALTVKLPKGAKALKPHVGQRAHLRLVRVTYDGFEKTQLLVPVVVFESGEVLDQALSALLLRGEFHDRDALGSPVPAEFVDDAVTEVLFELQRAVDAVEHQRFERASWQANRFLEDRLLVLARRRSVAHTKLEQAQLRWQGATGSDARTSAEDSKLKASAQVDALAAAIDKLERRDDSLFQRHRAHIEARRYSPPAVEVLLDVDLDLV